MSSAAARCCRSTPCSGHLRRLLPQLTRSALHRCLQRHGISRLWAPEAKSSARSGQFDDVELGYVPIDSCELRHAEGRLHMFVAIDRVTKFAYAAFCDAATKANGARFLQAVLEAFPYRIHTVLTDNGVAFTEQPRYREGATARFGGGHLFDRICDQHGIKHCLTKPYHPWTNRQVERSNRTIMEATIQAFRYPSLVALQAHVLVFVVARN